ncbi:MAG: heme o synthase [Ferruginibacter sp.]
MKTAEQDMTPAGAATTGLAAKVKDYFQLIKFTLSFMVVFSTVVSFLIAPSEKNFSREKYISVLLLFAGGMLITGAANAINQVLEKNSDALMKRTAKRPVASGRMSENEAVTFAVIAGLGGTALMWYCFNFQAAVISLFSLFLYGFIYTPLKKVNSISVLVGGIPGALPCLIGWVAAFGANDIEWAGGWILFGIQFLWQFPHFWAIAWLAHKDYTTAGFKLLPGDKGPERFTAVQSIMYSALMIPVGVLPYFYNICGATSMWIVLGCNLWMVYASVMLLLRMNAKSARTVMFSSYFYLMIVLLSLYADRVIH